MSAAATHGSLVPPQHPNQLIRSQAIPFEILVCLLHICTLVQADERMFPTTWPAHVRAAVVTVTVCSMAFHRGGFAATRTVDRLGWSMLSGRRTDNIACQSRLAQPRKSPDARYEDVGLASSVDFEVTDLLQSFGRQLLHLNFCCVAVYLKPPCCPVLAVGFAVDASCCFASNLLTCVQESLARAICC